MRLQLYAAQRNTGSQINQKTLAGSPYSAVLHTGYDLDYPKHFSPEFSLNQALIINFLPYIPISTILLPLAKR
jgi:hypothetical protein